jgi:GMP synthase (glutamine-hydrolysing)
MNRQARAPLVSPRLLCIEFESDAGPGRLGSDFESLGAQLEVVRVHRGQKLPDIGDFHGVIPLGGYMSAEDDEHFPYLGETALMLREATQRGVPVLGICLGAQILARAMGARIWRKPRMEVGFFPIHLTTAGIGDPLFAGISTSPISFQWHEDAFDLPASAVLLADSGRDSAQAFRIGTSYGVQFHPEVTTASVSSWCTSSQADLAAAAIPTTSDALLRKAREVEDAFGMQTAMLCKNWLAVVTATASRQTA